MKKNIQSSSSLAPLFDKLEKLTKPQRIAIWAGTVILVLAASVMLWLKPNYDNIQGLKKTLEQVRADLDKAKKNASELNDWRNQMKKKEAQYKTVMRALPEKEEIPSLLTGVSQAGRDAGLEFLLFQPKPESAKGFYAEIPVDINVSGTYHQVAVFFDKVANLPRIVNIREIKMAPQAQKGSVENTLATSCQAVTYKFIEEAEKAPKGGQAGKAKK